MTPLAVVGMSMISPLGLTPAQHAFFVRAEVGPAAPGAFLDEEGETLNVAYCPWLDARLPVADRLSALGARALAGALAPLGRDPGPEAALFVCSAAPRTGLDAEDRSACEQALQPLLRGHRAVRLTGEAGFFQGLEAAAALLQKGPERCAAVVAVDSLVSPALLAAWKRLSTTPWEANLPRPAEAAAAVLLMLPAEARRGGHEVLATIHHSASLRGGATDDDDLIVDGAPMTALLRAAPRSGLIGAAFGQQSIGSLRRREWGIAVARLSEAFRPDCAFVCLESAIGCVGAAAGAMSFVHGAAVNRHKAWPDAPRESEPFLAWAISRDGTRGLCAATVRG